MKHGNKSTTLCLELFVFISLIILVVLYRFWILKIFGYKYTDSDQSIMWLAAKNYSQGLFHEPRFYGQDYNTMLEALLAIPFTKLSIPLHIALPTITTLLTLFPISLIAIQAYHKTSKITGILILSLILALPAEYAFLTSISRGFVTGIAIASISFLFRSDSKKDFIAVSFLSIISYSINANSILLSIPYLFLLFLRNYRNKYFYLYSFIGFSIGFLIHYQISRFYINHPFYKIHGYVLNYSLDNFIKGISHLDKFYNYVTPYFWNHGWLVLLVFFSMSIVFLINKRHKESVFTFSIPFILIIPLFVSKVHDGTYSVFFSYSRMYIAIPILMVVIFSYLDLKDKRWIYFVVPGSLLFFTYQVFTAEQSLEKNLSKYHVVAIAETKWLYDECKKISDISSANKVDLIIIGNYCYGDFFNYGCPTCANNFPKTLKPSYERRAWRLLEDENKVYSNIMLIDTERNLSNEYNFISKIDERDWFYIIKRNKIPTIALLKKINFEVRKYK